MKSETPDQKWTRLQAQIQAGISTGYPNPERRGCPNRDVIAELAVRSADFDETIEEDPQWRHVTHCSPCYAEYLEEFRARRTRKSPTPPA